MYKGLVFMKKLNLMMDKGFTLIEVLLALVILSIILAISIFSIGSVKAKSEERTCQANQQLIEDGYEINFLFAYNDVTFSTYVIEHNYKQCLSKEGYTYEEGKVTCPLQPRENRTDEPHNEVPWL